MSVTRLEHILDREILVHRLAYDGYHCLGLTYSVRGERSGCARSVAVTDGGLAAKLLRLKRLFGRGVTQRVDGRTIRIERTVGPTGATYRVYVEVDQGGVTQFHEISKFEEEQL